MIDGIPVIDAIAHAYNFEQSNWANKSGEWIALAAYGGASTASRPGTPFPSQEMYLRDWSIEETANVMFLESDTDIAVHHTLPQFAFHDGGCSFEKSLEAKQRWPGRFITYAGVDPLAGEQALEELERQVEALQPIGIKLYPNSWTGEEVNDWLMDDPEVAFPVFQRAQELGVKVVAIHKALPLGPVPLAPYRVDDVDRAAITFPDLIFEVVHGGLAFLEESAWQLARFNNVYINLEGTSAYLARRPGAFRDALVALLQYGGEAALDKIMWGTGAILIHPQVLIETFVRDFSYPDELVEQYGLPPLTVDAKAKILGGNYARMAGIDLEARIKGNADDEFARRLEANGGLSDPYSTTLAAGALA